MPRRTVVSDPYPMVRLVDRTLRDDETGPVFVWDIDKTYLETRFSQVRHLVKIPFEWGIDKRAVPGAVELLHGLREGPTGREHRPLFFVTASPPQIAGALERKMLLDGVEFDGITYKDPVRLALSGQFHQLREQIAFKLSALLMLAVELPRRARIRLFGDDVEYDALVYSLFADVIAGRLRGEPLRDRLLAAGVHPAWAPRVVRAADEVRAREAVDGIYIRLARGPDGARIRGFSPHVLGYVHASSLVEPFLQQGLLSQRAAERVRQVASPGLLVQGERPPGPDGMWTPPA